MHTALGVGVREWKRGWHCEVRAGVDFGELEECY